MSIVEFDRVKVTTMTVVVNLEGNAIIEAAFPLLPVTKLDLPPIPITTKKFKIPWPGSEHAGKIFSTKFGNVTRGLIKSNKPKSFRNSIGIDICTTEKNISAKLSKNKIHMCGPTSEKLAVETAQHIINHLLAIQKELDYVNAHINERDEVIRWILKETKGENFVINEETQEIIQLEEGEMIRNNIVYQNGNAKYNYREIPFKWEDGDVINPENVIVNKYGQPYYRSLTKKEKKEGLSVYPLMKMDSIMKIHVEGDRVPVDDKGNKFNKVSRFPLRVLEVTSVKYPQSIIKGLKDEGRLIFPKNIDARIGSFLLSYLQDFAYHHVLADFLETFKEINRVYMNNEVPIEGNGSTMVLEALEDKKVEMRKIPFSIGKLSIAMINYSFSVGMNVDRWALCQLIDGYKNFKATFNNTTDHHVTVTAPYTADEGEVIKRKNSPSISFLVYKSGVVTQSGPNPKLMRESYYDFMNFLKDNRDKVALKDGKPFSIKFRPQVSTQVQI